MIEPRENDRLDGIPAHATSDEVIARLVVDELFWDPRVDASKIQVQVTDGVATLSGRVPTVADRFTAEADARLIYGVAAVENHIEVDRSRPVPDRELSSDIAKMLDWTPDIDDSGIEVLARDGVVTLKGTVYSYWEKLRAHLLASRMKGVSKLVDELVVTPSHSLADREIAASLTGALERRLMDDVKLVQVTVKDGVVTLRGSVSNAAAFRSAQEAAEHTTGVVAVHNELKFPKTR